MPSHPGALSFGIAATASLISFRLDLRHPDFLQEVFDFGSLNLLLFPCDSAIALENSSYGCLQPGRPLRILAGRGLGASPGVEEGYHARFLFQEGYVEVGGSCGRGGGAPPDGICEAVLQSQLMPGGYFSHVHSPLPCPASGFHLFQMVEVPTDYGVVGCEVCLANLFPQEGLASRRSRGVRVDNS
ncbi:unnamed protein product [Sphagnum balticum]